ncbi:hypothetical protein JVT61DRAFT_12046 [Boletus reticuloceps]|uniref:Uncharacterized protein n=1 Tax=Boletus reticuloceps TaxID=495285 RepID=A0A8I3A4H5_9AGAM|nr:hypothetical protein JVT61DRAFT_12046 [Boletus reticuloceps]
MLEVGYIERKGRRFKLSVKVDKNSTQCVDSLPKDLTTWTHEELWKSDKEDEDGERISRKAFKRWRRREEVARKEAEVVARRKAENCRAEKKERRVKEATKRAEEVVRKGTV